MPTENNNDNSYSNESSCDQQQPDIQANQDLVQY